MARLYGARAVKIGDRSELFTTAEALDLCAQRNRVAEIERIEMGCWHEHAIELGFHAKPLIEPKMTDPQFAHLDDDISKGFSDRENAVAIARYEWREQRQILDAIEDKWQKDRPVDVDWLRIEVPGYKREDGSPAHIRAEDLKLAEKNEHGNIKIGGYVVSQTDFKNMDQQRKNYEAIYEHAHQ